MSMADNTSVTSVFDASAPNRAAAEAQASLGIVSLRGRASGAFRKINVPSVP
jgi:hypothetical protein